MKKFKIRTYRCLSDNVTIKDSKELSKETLKKQFYCSDEAFKKFAIVKKKFIAGCVFETAYP